MNENKIMKNEMNKLINETWYKRLVDDCKAIITEAVFTSRWALVEGYWQLGERVRKDENWTKYSKGTYTSLQGLAKNLGISERILYYALQFYDKYPELNNVPEGKNITWNKIITKYLPEKPKEIIPFPEGKYSIIYADPPWKYYEGGHKNQSRYYNTMTIDEICNLPVKDLTADNCILFLWVTFPILPDCFKVIESWGFKYSTCGFVWIKSKQDRTGFAFGLGSWTRSNAELCLIATKGSIERKDASISQIIYEPLEEHSKKPNIVRDKIIQLVGDLPRIELFAKGKLSNGWDGWGQEFERI